MQYADAADAKSFHGQPRFYRESLNGLARALEAFQRERVDAVLVRYLKRGRGSNRVAVGHGWVLLGSRGLAVAAWWRRPDDSPSAN